MTIDASGPFTIREADQTMLDVSRLVEKIIAGPNGKFVIGFGDQAYTLTEHVQCPWSALSLMGPEGVARAT